MSASFLKLQIEGHVAWLTLDNPEKLNAMGPEFWDGMVPTMASIDADPQVRVVVIRGAGRAFSAGLDLMRMLPRLPLDPTRAPDGAQKMALHRMIRQMQAAITSVERCRVPVIAAVHGHCLGGGVDLITAADVRLCAADARFGIRETRLAMVADVGTLQRLPAIVGPGVARELVFSGRDFDADEASRIGLINRVLPDPGALFEAAGALAAQIAAQPPLAVQGAKAVLNEARRHEVDRSLEYVATWNAAHLVSHDLARAAAAFGSKEPPEFEGR